VVRNNAAEGRNEIGGMVSERRLEIVGYPDSNKMTLVKSIDPGGVHALVKEAVQLAPRK
jgi:hypothetical protein